VDISGWLTQTIHVAAMAGANANAEPTYGTPLPVACRSEAKFQKIIDASGQEVMSDHQVVTLEEIGPQDAVWLPGADTADPTAARMPLRTQQAVDKAGRGRFWEVFF
jgi:hypothetical protein